MHVKPSESVTSRLPDLVNWQGARGISARESSAVAGGDETGNSALTAFPTDAYPSNPMVAAVTNSLPPQTVANEGWESKEEGADNSADEGGTGSADDDDDEEEDDEEEEEEGDDTGWLRVAAERLSMR